MTKVNYRKVFRIRLLLCTMAMLLVAGSMRAEVFYWQGKSLNWHDLNNWNMETGPAHRLPDINDIVILSASARETELRLTKDAAVSALIATDDRAYRISATSNVILTVTRHLNLNQNVELSDKISLVLGAAGVASGTFACSPAVAKRLTYHSPETERIFASTASLAGGRASCASFTIVPEIVNPTCNGDDDGVAGVEVPADGTGPFTYQWVGGPSTRLWTGVGAGTYTVIVIDVGQGGLPCSADIFINEPGPLTVFSMNGTPPFCAGECNGAATPIIIGGNGGYNLSYSSGETGPTASALCATFTLNVVDQAGCAFSTDFTFPNAPDPIQVDADIDGITCTDENDAAISLTTSGGVAPYSFSWTGPSGFSSTDSDISGLAAGTYELTVEDDNACEFTTSYVIVNPSDISVVPTIVNNICPDESEGIINLDVMGGTGAYTFSWSGPDGFTSDAQNINGLPQGSYALSLTDANGCLFEDTYEIVAPASIVVSASLNDVLCFGASTGSIDGSATGGSGAFTFAWTGPDGFSATTSSIANLPIGEYTLEVTDANGCIGVEVFEIAQSELLTADLSASPVSCVGNGDGSVATLPGGGVAPYAFSWAGPGGFTSVDQDLSNLEPGTYTLTLTDANNCVTNEATEVLDATPIVVSGTVTNTTCATGNTGAISIEVAGGDEPFTYAWNGPAGFSSGDQNISSLAAGAYSVIVTDSQGCTGTANFTVSSPAALTATFVTTPVACFGGNTGAINTTPAGGLAPYTYVWLGPGGFFSTSQNISGLLGGTYTLQLTDANGCFAFIDAIVPQQPQITISRVITNVTCFGGSNGAINITAGGGTPGYTFSWTGPNGFAATTEDISGIQAGSYVVVVTDGNGCTGTRTYNVTQPAAITFNGNITNVVCAGDDDGSIATSIATGAGPFTFSWTGPNGFVATGANISDLQAGVYTITATNTLGCTGSSEFEVEEAPAITVDAVIQGITCFGESNGSISIAVTGGQEPYVIDWAGPDGFTSDQLSLTNLEAGEYILEITDDFGCEVAFTYQITSPAELTLDVLATDISCFNLNDGTASITANGGTLPYTIEWTGPEGFTSTDEDLTSLSEGSYSILITDANGCSVSDSVEVMNPTALSIVLNATEPSCLADDGQLEVLASGGTVAADYTYEWTTSGGLVIGSDPILENLAPGTYTITVSDDNGCEASQTFELFRESINLTAAVSNALCADSASGSIVVNASSGTPPFSFSWSGPDGFTSTDSSISGLLAGAYSLQASDAAGCVVNEVYDVGEPAPIVIDATLVPESCPGAANGQISLSLTGGTPGFLYTWTGPDGFTAATANISNLTAGMYEVTATDVNACEASAVYTLDIDSEIGFVFSTTDPDCFGESTGSISTEVVGGQAPFTYSWVGPEGFTASTEDLFSLPAGEYTLSLTDAAGCEASEMVTLTDPALLEVTAVVTNSTCLEANGSAVATATGGTGAITYEWTNLFGGSLGSDPTLSNVFAAVYIITVTDENGCTASDVITISDANGSVSGIVTPISCFGASDGAIDITVEDGEAPFVYDWSDETGFFANTQNVSGLTAGEYAVTVTDVNGCAYSATFELNDPASIQATAEIDLVGCAGSDGAITLTITGGEAEYTVEWTGPNGFTGTGLNIADLEPGTYEYSIVDAALCTGSGSIELELSPDIMVMEDLVSPICGSESDGSIELEVSGGTAPYSFAWTGPNDFSADTQNISGLAGGTYNVTVTDVSGCEVDFEFVLTQPELLQIDIAVTQPDCGESNGALLATITGGVEGSGYWINWTDGLGNSLGGANPIENLAPGSYSLTAIDDNGCETDTTLNLSNPGIDVEAVVTGVTCADVNNGSILLSITSENPPFDVLWEGPAGFTASTNDISDLEPGVYTYTVTAADGCSASASVEVDDAQALGVGVDVTAACFGESNGSISLELFNAQGEVSITWTDGTDIIGTGLALADLAAGTYTYEVTDASACVVSGDVEVLQNPEIIATLSSVSPSCFGSDNGSAQVEITGGVAPYTLNWEGPEGFSSSDTDLSNLIAGLYTLSIEDASGCEITAGLTLTQPDSLQAIVEIDLPDCDDLNGPSDIALTANGGTDPYEILWTGPSGFTSTDFSLSDVLPGIYEYLITDAQGCQSAGEVEVPTREALDVDATLQNISCNGVADGAIGIEIIGGLGTVGIDWLGPNDFFSNQASIDNLQAGVYTLILEDSVGCGFTTTFELTQPGRLSVSAEVSDASCNTSLDGSASVGITGGTAPYETIWTGSDGSTFTGNAITDLPPGTYAALITDANGCTDEAEVEVDFTLEISANAGDDISICASDLPTTITGISEGGDLNYWLDLDGDTLAVENTYMISQFAPGSYTFVFGVSNGLCNASDTVIVDVLIGPSVDAGPDLEVFAEQVFTLGGSPTAQDAESFAWSPSAEGNFDVTAANPSGFLLETTQFSVTVTDADGCQASDTVQVNILPAVTITSGFTPNNDGVNDTWIIDNIELFPNSLVSVFNRWGTLIYQQRAYNMGNAWDGTYEGSLVPVGTYYYAIELNDDRFPEPFTGPITLYR